VKEEVEVLQIVLVEQLFRVHLILHLQMNMQFAEAVSVVYPQMVMVDMQSSVAEEGVMKTAPVEAPYSVGVEARE
jgi:hypothetical protein